MTNKQVEQPAGVYELLSCAPHFTGCEAPEPSLSSLIYRYYRAHFEDGTHAGALARDYIRAIVDADRKARAPVAYPNEPTEEMVAAGCRAMGALYGHEGARQCWLAMSAAAPQPAGGADELQKRTDALYVALEVCSAELFAQCADKPRAMKYVEQARHALAMEQCARAAAGRTAQVNPLSGSAAPQVDGVEPDAETRMALADAPKSLRSYVSELQAALAAQGQEAEPVGVIRESSEPGIAPYADIWPWLTPGTKLYAGHPPRTQADAPAGPAAREQIIGSALYAAINEMMAHLGRDGEIDTRHPAVEGVMSALHEIDGGAPAHRQMR